MADFAFTRQDEKSITSGTFIGHKGAVWSARLSDDATLAATGSADFSAKVWDTFSGETLHTLQHNHIVRAVAFPPQPQPTILATGGMEKKLRIFDLSRGSGDSTTPTNGNGNGAASATSYEVGSGEHTDAIKHIVWTRDPNIITTASDDQQIRWWDLRTRAAIAAQRIDGLPRSCELNTGFGATAAGGIVSVAAGKNLYFFDAARPGGPPLKHIRTDREMACVALNGDARRFVTGSPNDTWVHVWDFESGQELETGRGHHGPVWTTCFSPDGRMYATGSEDGTVKLWKFTEGPYGLWR